MLPHGVPSLLCSLVTYLFYHLFRELLGKNQLVIEKEYVFSTKKTEHLDFHNIVGLYLMKCLSKNESKKDKNNLSTHRVIMAGKWCYWNWHIQRLYLERCTDSPQWCPDVKESCSSYSHVSVGLLYQGAAYQKLQWRSITKGSLAESFNHTLVM